MFVNTLLFLLEKVTVFKSFILICNFLFIISVISTRLQFWITKIPKVLWDKILEEGNSTD